MNTANKLTLLRVFLIPAFYVVMELGFPGSDWLALIIFAAATLTDFADGKIARTRNQITDFGKFMDPLADKLLVTAALLLFIERGQMPSWSVMIILAREFAVTALRLIAVGNGVVIAAAWSGKIKTAVSTVGICVMLTPLSGLMIAPGVFSLNDLIVALILITTVWSGVEYFAKNIKMISIK